MEVISVTNATKKSGVKAFSNNSINHNFSNNIHNNNNNNNSSIEEKRIERIEDVMLLKNSVQNCETKKFDKQQNTVTHAPRLRPYEKAFLPSYLDPSITVGYKYKVRQNGSSTYLFGGKSLYLEAIHQDNQSTELIFEQGKKISVQRNCQHCNNKFAAGYAVSISLLERGMVFKMYQDDEKVGTCTITDVAGDQQIVSNTTGIKPSFIDFKEIQCNFQCQLTLNNKRMETDVAGFVTTMKRPDENAVIKCVEALLLPRGEMFKLLP